MIAGLLLAGRSRWRRVRDRARLARMARDADRGPRAAPATASLSYDVFDTALVRRTGSPRSTHLHLGRRLVAAELLRGTPDEFARRRAQAEQAAFDAAGGPDAHVHLTDVYDVLHRSWPELLTDAPAAAQEELHHEAAVLVGVRETRAELSGPSRPDVAFVSDTHHSEAFLAERLREQGLLREGDRCYTSSDRARSKTSGRLFDLLLRDLQVPPGHVVHRGNDPWTDWASPRRHGLRVLPFPQGNPDRYERALDGHRDTTDGLAGRLAGASRVARLRLPAGDAHEAALRDVATGVAAPVVIAFLLWALGRARALGLRRLCFVSRDGQVLHDVARELVGLLALDVELHYLHGSRRAWSLPALHRGGTGTPAPVSPGADVDHLSVRVLLDRFGLRCEEVAGPLRRLGLPEDRWDSDLPGEERTRVAGALLADDEVGALAQARGEQQRDLLTDYLAQQGVLDGEPFALVDVSTGGTLHAALTAALPPDSPAPTSLILGLRRGAVVAGDPRVETWFPPDGSGAPPVPEGLVPGLELFALADHETVLGYERVGDSVRPVLAPGEGRAARGWGQPLVRSALVATARGLVVDESDLDVDLRAAVGDVFSRFWRSPTLAEARAWGGAPLEDGWGAHSFPVRLAEPFRLGPAVARVVPQRRRAGSRAVRTWRGGSLRLTPLPVRAGVRLAFSARDLLRGSR